MLISRQYKISHPVFKIIMVDFVYMIALVSDDYAYIMLDGEKGSKGPHHMVQFVDVEEAVRPFNLIVDKMSTGKISDLIAGMVLVDALNVQILKVGATEIEEMRKYLPGGKMMGASMSTGMGPEFPAPLAVFEKAVLDRWGYTTLKKIVAGKVLKMFKEQFSDTLEKAPQELKDKIEKLIQETESNTPNKEDKKDFKFSDN